MDFLKKYVKIIFITLIVIVLILLFSVVSFRQPSQTPNNIVVEPSPISDIEKILPIQFSLDTVVVGQTTEQEIQSIPNIYARENLGNGYTAYYIGEKSQVRMNRIIVKNQIVVYKSERIIETTTSKLPPATSYLDQYGSPDAKYIGSFFYGDNATYFVYAKKGFTFIANEYTGQVYEIQLFLPTTLDQYKKLYGADIAPPVTQIGY